MSCVRVPPRARQGRGSRGSCQACSFILTRWKIHWERCVMYTTATVINFLTLSLSLSILLSFPSPSSSLFALISLSLSILHFLLCTFSFLFYNAANILFLRAPLLKSNTLFWRSSSYFLQCFHSIFNNTYIFSSGRLRFSIITQGIPKYADTTHAYQ